MPLLMGCTRQSRIMESDGLETFYYDPVTQMTYLSRTVGTRSLKSSFTKVSVSNQKLDQKNEIDDKKNV